MEGRVPEDLAVVVDAGGAVLVWSDGARRLLGHTSAEIVDRPVAELLAAALPSSTRRHVADGQPWSGEVALRHRNGDRIVVRLQGTPLLDADGRRLWLVTGSAPAHLARRTGYRPTALWDLTLSQLPVPVAVYDRQARLVAANEIMTQVMGRTAEEMRGLTLWEIQRLRPERGAAELGYMFLPRAWGRGYAAEACAAVLDWSADALPGEPVVLCTRSANTPSMRLAARLGFSEVERFEEYGAEQWFGVRPPVTASG